MITIKKLDDTIFEAKRFIEKAELAKQSIIENDYAFLGTKETGSARRASMDLTRSLADLRRV